MKNAEQQYRDAFERLKAGSPQIVDKNMPINELNTVALEAGKKIGSLRKSNLKELCEEILEYEVSETPLQACARIKQEYKEQRDDNDVLWKNALARELMLKKRLIELEIEIKRLKQKYPGIVFELEDLDNE
jgi:hypothetical protein